MAAAPPIEEALFRLPDAGNESGRERFLQVRQGFQMPIREAIWKQCNKPRSIIRLKHRQVLRKGSLCIV